MLGQTHSAHVVFTVVQLIRIPHDLHLFSMDWKMGKVFKSNT